VAEPTPVPVRRKRNYPKTRNTPKGKAQLFIEYAATYTWRRVSDLAVQHGQEDRVRHRRVLSARWQSKQHDGASRRSCGCQGVSRPCLAAQAAHLPKYCHNPSCVAPRHLYWAEPVRNNTDRYADETMFVKNYVTQRSIADATGYKQSTVSRALADSPLIDQDVRDIIQKVAAEMGVPERSPHGSRRAST
jgi:hypothetical protein